jgi:Ca2+-binding RTX toxin-like protein
MTNTYNNSQEAEDFILNIAPRALVGLSNPDALGSQYWNLSATTFGSASFGTAWGFATGAGVTISIVDEGVNYLHADLAGQYDRSIDYDPLDAGAPDARPDRLYESHGTQVAGIIAGSATNDFGTVGASPDATITASYLRFRGVTIDTLVDIFTHQASYDVSNNSWGFTSAFADNAAEAYFAPVADAIELAATTGRGGLGTAMVFAAGNGKISVAGQNIGDDANFHSLSNNRFAIAVGAHDEAGESAFFSSPGANVLLSAPGMSLRTTTGLGEGATDSTYVSGTSFAAPMVSSAIALMLQANPNLGYRDIQEILAISADPSRSGLAATNHASNVNGGGMVFEREMGFGALNALAAVNLARSWQSQHTAANEEHIAADFVLPVSVDPLTEVLTLDVVNPGSSDFSLDFVELSLTLEDADLADLRIELVSPDGTSTLIAPNLKAAGGRTSLDFTFSSVATWGESPFGTWTLQLSHPDAASGDFQVLGANLDFYGDTITVDDDYIFTASYARLVAANASRRTIHDIDGGTDRLNFAAAAEGVTASLSGGANAVGRTAFVLNGAFENIFGSIHDDCFSGSAASNVIRGDFGDDWVAGLGGDDFLDGGAGNDTILGGDGADSIDGGAGFDTAAFAAPVVLNFATGVHGDAAAGDLFVRIEHFALSAGNDIFVGSAAAVNETVDGGAGADYRDAGAGNDHLDGGTGADVMIGGAGNDVFIFDAASDVAREAAGQGLDAIVSAVSLTLGANIENLELAGSARKGVGNGLDNTIIGNSAANELKGAGGDDHLEGGKSKDRVNGGKGDDTIDGGSGKDDLKGGKGDDDIEGGGGRDVLTGGKGRDTFVFNSHKSVERITDFEHDKDTIDLSGMDANVRRHGNNKFKFIGDDDFTGKRGQLHFEHDGGDTIVTADRNGDGSADFKVILDGHHHLTAGDFIL